MREKITKNRKYILMVLGILILSTLYVGMKYLMRPKYEPLPVVKLKDKETNKKKFAVMVQNGDGYVEYTSEDGTWPSEDDYEFKEAKCIDNNGSLVNNAVTFANGKVTLKTNKTIYCTLYFDESIKTTIQLLRKNDPQNKLSSETVGGMYRYQGKNTDTINNYICFGTDNKEECTNESTGYDQYMYRIIGITEDGQLYLIKMKGVEEGNNKTFYWNTSYCCDSPWIWTHLYKALNGSTSNGNIFINNTRYNYMVEENEWYNKIESHNWKYGEIKDISNNGITIYNTENVWCNDIEAKIGLMYLHDYYLAYDNERNWNSDYDTSNWIHFVNNKNTTGANEELLLSKYGYEKVYDPTCKCGVACPEPPSCPPPAGPANPEVPSISNNLESSSKYKVVDSMELRSLISPNNIAPTVSCPEYHTFSYIVNDAGNLDYLYANGLARPTFYLKSDTKIKSGTGSITDPYILNIK